MRKKEKDPPKIDYRTEAKPRTMASGIPVFCAHDEILPLEKIIPNPQNPNQHPKSQITLLSQIIKAQGWRAPITISTRSGYVVAGHGRLLAAYEMGAADAPVDYQNFATEAEEYAALIADNRIAEFSENDETMLAEILSSLQLDDMPLELAGFTDEDLEEILNGIAGTEEEPEEEEPERSDIPMCKQGDVWEMGGHTLTIGAVVEDGDYIISCYVQETNNIGITCTRDGETYSYIDMVREWARVNGREDEIEGMKVPVIVVKKRKHKNVTEEV